MQQTRGRRLETRALLAFAVVVLTLQAPGWAQGGVVGLPAGAVAHLPGVTEIFARDTTDPPEILEDETFVPGQLLVRFNLDLNDANIEMVALAAGATSVERLSPIGLFRVHTTPTVPAVESLMMALWQADVAVTIEPNYTGGGLAFVPNDPHHLNGNQWHLEDPSDIDLDLEQAWDITRGSEEVVIVVIDTGLDINHPEFLGRVYVNSGEIPGNFIDDDGNGYVDDVSGWNGVDNDHIVINGDNGHGTWVASIIMANSNNDHQVAGFDHFAKLLPLKALNGPLGRLDHLVAALDYLILNPEIADLVNMSLANYTPLASLEDALSAVARSSILIGGSGNDGTSTGADRKFPESHPDVITVSGTDRFDERAYFSDSGNTVEVSAPSVDIHTAAAGTANDPGDPNDPFAVFSGIGTSFAAPMVTGTASLCLAIRATMDRADLEFALAEGAVDLGPPGRDTDFGYGRVNTHETLLAIQTLVFIDGFETGDLSEWSEFSP